MKRLTLLIVAIVFISAFGASAETRQGPPEALETVENGWSPFQFAVFNPLQLFNEGKDIVGLRLNLVYGRNADVSGIDLGLGVNSSHNFTGIQIAGIMNNAAGDPGDFMGIGIQIACLGNTTDHLYGIQIGGLGNGVTNDATGIQIGLVGNVASTVKGIQIGGLYNFNYAQNSSITGIQIGIFNYSDNVTGIQVGLYNECSDMKGIQVGILNHINKSRVRFMPIINAKF
ncbi:MAG: hypothetical protein ABIK92_20565 [Pseudomonadota bacterium]